MEPLRRRTLGAAVPTLLTLLFSGCGGDPVDRLAEGERARVEAAFAGGRLRLEGGGRVRLAGVDVPGAGEPGGAAAEAALRRLTERQEVRLLYGGGRRDGFDQALAHVRTTRGRRWVQGELLQAGLARVRTTADDRALAPEMLRLEAGARAAGRGAWAAPAWRVRLPAEVEPGFALVEGRVAEAERARSGLRLRFSSSTLEVELSRGAAADLDAGGTPAADLLGALIRVRGVIRQAGGRRFLRVDHPEQIERLRAR